MPFKTCVFPTHFAFGEFGASFEPSKHEKKWQNCSIYQPMPQSRRRIHFFYK